MSTNDPSTRASAFPKSRRILVFILRHGEREDEAMKSSKVRRLSPSRRFDPALTPKGHDQARRAWKHLSSALVSTDCKRVSIFTSPLRRAVGTAMMVSDAVSVMQDRGCQVVVPGKLQEHEQYPTVREAPDNDKRKSSPIPIVVWNGLCDCAAQIERVGGHQNAIRTGFVSCAATETLSPKTFDESSMASTWQEMQQAALESSNTTNSSASGVPLQFWKAHSSAQALVPMSPSLSLQQHRSLPNGTTSSVNMRDDPPVRDNIRYDLLPADTPKEPPVDQAVRIALKAGCDACIIASHREEIRELYKYRSGYRFSRKSLDYCCIGAFEVMIDTCPDVENDETCSPRLEWRFHDVIPYREFIPDFVRVVKNSYVAPTSLTNDGACPLEWFPSVEGKSFGPCLVQVSLVHSDLIPTVRMEEEQCEIIEILFDRVSTNATKRRGIMTLEIRSGAIHWAEALLILVNDGSSAVIGTASIRSRSTEKISKFEVILIPESQHVLPCPPRTIHLGVL